jgi:hypothetical protein
MHLSIGADHNQEKHLRLNAAQPLFLRPTVGALSCHFRAKFSTL